MSTLAQIEAELANSEGIEPLLCETNAKPLITSAFRAPQSKPAHHLIQWNEPKFVIHSSQTHVSPTVKTGRNDPCPCESGRKYKVVVCGTKPIQPVGLPLNATQETCL